MSGLLGLRRGLGPLRPSRRANPFTNPGVPTALQKRNGLGQRYPTETDLSLPCVQAIRERRPSLLPRGSKAKTAARIAGEYPTHTQSTPNLSVPASGGMAGGGFQADKIPEERLLTAMGGCAAIEGRGYSTSPRRLTSRAPAVLPPWLNRSDGGGFFVGLADWGQI